MGCCIKVARQWACPMALVVIAGCGTASPVPTRAVPSAPQPTVSLSTPRPSTEAIHVIIGGDAGWFPGAGAAIDPGHPSTTLSPGLGRQLSKADLTGHEQLSAVAHSANVAPGGPPLASPLLNGQRGLLYLGRPADSERWPDLHLAGGAAADRVLVRAATTFSLSVTGALATAIATDVATSENPSTQMDVKVRSTLEGEDVTWSPVQDHYRIEGWAGDHLLVTRSRGEASPPDLLRLDGPQAVTVLAQSGTLIGLSPDGRTAAIDRVDTANPSRNLDELIDVASGQVVGRIDSSASKADVSLGAGNWDATGFVTWGFADGRPSLFTYVADARGLTLAASKSFEAGVFPSFFSPTRGSDGSIVAFAPDGPIPRPGPAHVIPDNPYAMLMCSTDLSVCDKMLLPGKDQFDVVRTASR